MSAPTVGDTYQKLGRQRIVTAVNDHWYSTGLGGKRVSYDEVRVKSGSCRRLYCSLGAWLSWTKSATKINSNG